MSIQHAMEHKGNLAERTIEFEVNLKTPGVLEQIGFVVFLAHKFEGEIEEIGQSFKKPDYPYGTIELRFPDEHRFHEAEEFCKENLTESGLTIRGTREEVEHSDPRGAEAQELHRRIFKVPLKEEV